MERDLKLERIETAIGVGLRIDFRDAGGQTELVMERERGPECQLHWGLLREGNGSWSAPPRSSWPAGSTPAGGGVRSPFALRDGAPCFALPLESLSGYAVLTFALFDPHSGRWDNNRGRNYQVGLPTARHAPLWIEAARSPSADAPTRESVFSLADGHGLAVVVRSFEDRAEITLATDLEGPLLLHWGMVEAGQRQWRHPPTSACPPHTTWVDERAAQSLFEERGDVRVLRLSIPDRDRKGALSFVLLQNDDGTKARWWKDGAHDFFVPLAKAPALGPFASPVCQELLETIVAHETSDASWSLMHRYHLASELLGRVRPEDDEALALLFVWLRFSMLRQLDWQRNYNTKPRELAHAQDRLTRAIAERYAASARERPLLRSLAGTFGRGGEGGQAIRDGILEIMHRHHLKEVAGTFVEEWHQKLHNNTTPDDVLICEAYLEFLRRGGDRAAFYSTLAKGGVDRERLRSYERPIRSEPEFVPALRDRLLEEFGRFLGILRAVHSATDLEAAARAARALLGPAVREKLDSLQRHRDPEGAEATRALEAITSVREALAVAFEGEGRGRAELLYLDLALDDFTRRVIEQNLHHSLDLDRLAAWSDLALHGLSLSRPAEELALGLRHLRRAWTVPRVGGGEWALFAEAPVERLERELAALIDADFRLLQKLAETLGPAVGAADWAVVGFGEGVVRGRLDFVVSALLRKVDERLSELAETGRWRVVSWPGHPAIGRLEVRASLDEPVVAPRTDPTVVVTDVRGDEDIPDGVTAIVTGASVDLLSHLAVRARNDGVLLATCREPSALADLRGRDGQWLRLEVSPAGDVTAEPVEASAAAPRAPRPSLRPLARPSSSHLAVLTADQFRQDNVGGKALNLQRLRGLLPSWIHVPTSAALPFGTFEAVLEHDRNRAVAAEVRATMARLSDGAGKDARGVLSGLREEVLRLECPSELEEALRHTLAAIGLPPPDPWEDAWRAITRVWASRWNDRARASRRREGLSESDVFMGVLIQEVVPAEYAFVIHTTHPVTGDPEELFAEVVAGLGETLVGNHPGRALGFSLRRGHEVPRLSSLPSKSVALRGRGLIFRSDSNTEDRPGAAGAGLHDSVVLTPEEPVRIDYTDERLLWDDAFRKDVLCSIGRIGFEVEAALGGPQDVEGVYEHGSFYVVQARPQAGRQPPNE